MHIQWYAEDASARIFTGKRNGNINIADLADCSDIYGADFKLNLLGLCRSGKWKRTSWGYEASIRRRST